MDMKERAKKLKIDIPAVVIALKKKDTPIIAKITAGITIAYALSPIDLIPDFIPVLGYLDDLIILPLLISLTVKLIPTEIFVQCRQEAEVHLSIGNTKKWYYALPILLIWIFFIFIVIKTIISIF